MFRLFAQRGHQVHIIAVPAWTGEAPLVEAGIPVSRLAIRNRLDFKAVWILRRMLRQLSPDVIYAPRNRSLSVTLMATWGTKYPVAGYRGTMGHLSRWDPASWLTYLHPRLAHIACVSEAVRQYLLKMKISETKLSTIYKGHRVSWYEGRDSVDLSSFGIPAGAFVVGFTGNIRPVKGVDVLLQSLAFIPESHNIHFCLVGEVRDPSIKALCESPFIAGRAHFSGYQRDASRFCRNFDVFVMPSVEREGLPRAVIEAMAQGVAPIVSSVGGQPELVEDGVSGLVVPPRDPKRLAEAIMTLFSSPELRRQLGDQARRRIDTEFNVEITTQKMLSMFSRLLSDCDLT